MQTQNYKSIKTLKQKKKIQKCKPKNIKHTNVQI